MLGRMRLALLLALCLAASGCWKEIHEAAAPPLDPPSAITQGATPSVAPGITRPPTDRSACRT